MNKQSFKQLKHIIAHLPKSKILAGESVPNGQYRFYLSGQKEVRINIAISNQDAIIMGDGGIANIDFAKGKYSYSSHNFGFFSNNKNIETEYIYRAIEEFLPVLDYKGFVGSGIKNIDKSFLFDLYIQIPPLQKQKKITSILNSVDEVIKNTLRQINKLQDLKKATMNELLTNGIGYTEFKDSKLGKIPNSWKIKTIGELTSKVGSGVTPRGGSSVYQKQGIIFIRSQNVHFDGLKLDDIAFISRKIHDGMMGSKVCSGDVLLNITGASIGRCTVVPDSFPESNVNQHVCIIRPTNLLHNNFLSMWLSSDYGQSQIMKFQAGGNREGLNFEQIRSILIPIPSLKEQKQSTMIVNAVQLLVNKLKIKLTQTHSLKKSLMQNLLKGKVRVKVN